MSRRSPLAPFSRLETGALYGCMMVSAFALAIGSIAAWLWLTVLGIGVLLFSLLTMQFVQRLRARRQ